MELLSREIEARQNTLADYYATKQGLDGLIGDTKALRDQLRKGPSSSTAGELPILLLRANAFMASTRLPLQLELSLGQMAGLEGSAEDQLGDLDILISVLEATREEVESLISEGSIQQEVL